MRTCRVSGASLLLLLAQTVSAGAQEPLSQPRYDVRVEFDVRVPMRDGTELSADIRRPDAEGRFPVILVRSPYNNNSDGIVENGRFFAERGYAVVVQDVRGRWDSAGTFHAFVNEARDGYDTHEWAGRQPWSNGNVGTLGGSYVGLTPSCAKTRPF